MSENTLPQEEQIKILARRVADLELICARMVEFFTRNDVKNLERQDFVNHLRILAKSKYGEKSLVGDDGALYDVAKLIRIKATWPS